MNTGWNSKLEVQDVILGILYQPLHHLLPHFLSVHSDYSVCILGGSSLLSHSSGTSQPTQTVTLLPRHHVLPDLHSSASNSHLTFPSALLPHAPPRNNSQRRLKPDFLFPTLREALILICHFWGTQGMVI